LPLAAFQTASPPHAGQANFCRASTDVLGGDGSSDALAAPLTN
jgi:hypothetical protein